MQGGDVLGAKLERGDAELTLYDTLKPVAGALLWLLVRLRVEGREHVPEQGPFIVACNHVFDVDIVGLAYALYPLHVHYMAKEELFRGKALGSLVRGLHAYPVNRARPGPSFVKHTLAILQSGGVVGIFPEGTRYHTGELGPLKTGAVRIALRQGPCGSQNDTAQAQDQTRHGILLDRSNKAR